MCNMELRETRALDNMNKAIDMMEIFERASIRSHGSYLIHGAIYKTTRDILSVGDVWAVDLSPLELQNAETKRTASNSGSKHLTVSSAGVARAPQLKGKEGPAKLVCTKGYSTTMAVSTLKNVLASQYLRRGEGIAALKDSRRKVRLFDTGRSKLRSSGPSASKSVDENKYDAFSDTCIRAFIRLLADMVETQQESTAA